MTAAELKRYAQAMAVTMQDSRTEGEKAAARQVMDRINARCMERTRITQAYAFPADKTSSYSRYI